MNTEEKRKKHVILEQEDYRNPWFSVSKEKIRYPNNTEHEYYILRRRNFFVSIIALEHDTLILLKQWRPTFLDYIYELPMGAIDKGETPLTAAKREFWEETGYKAKSWEKLGEFMVAPGHSDQKGFVFLATGLKKITGQAQDNPTEIIEVLTIPFAEVMKMIQKGLFCDAPSLASLMMLNARNLNG